MKEFVDGYSFVKEIVEYSRENAVDVLMSKAIDECDWLELKASFYVSDSDPDFSNAKLLSKKPEGYGDRQWLDELNKGRIVKDVVAMYNSRGGVILIGITPDYAHRLVPMQRNDPHGILSSGSKGVNDYLTKINDQLAKGYFWFGTARHYLSRPMKELYEATILPYKAGCVIALIVKSAGNNASCAITCDDEGSSRNAKSYLVFRTEAGNNREEVISGITGRKKDELDQLRFSLLHKRDLDRLFTEMTGGEFSGRPSTPVGWNEVWYRLWTFSLRGKASRAELWKAYGYYCAFIASAICLTMVFGSNRILSIAQFLGFVLLAPPFVRRLHDLGLSGWCLLVWIGLGMFEGVFPNLTSVSRIINGFFYLLLLSLGCFPGRRIYGKYKGGAVGIAFFALLLLAGLMNREATSSTDIDGGTAVMPGLVEDQEPTLQETIVCAVDAVGNKYEDSFDNVVIPTLRARKGNGIAVFGLTVERMAADMHRVEYLAAHLIKSQESEDQGVGEEFYGMLKDLIGALDDVARVSMRENVTLGEIQQSFAKVDATSDRFFRKADVLCKDRWKGPFRGLIYRIEDALKP